MTLYSLDTVKKKSEWYAVKLTFIQKSLHFFCRTIWDNSLPMGQTDFYKFFLWPTSSTHCKVVQGEILLMVASPFLFYSNKTKKTYLLVEKN